MMMYMSVMSESGRTWPLTAPCTSTTMTTYISGLFMFGTASVLQRTMHEHHDEGRRRQPRQQPHKGLLHARQLQAATVVALRLRVLAVHVKAALCAHPAILCNPLTHRGQQLKDSPRNIHVSNMHCQMHPARTQRSSPIFSYTLWSDIAAQRVKVALLSSAWRRLGLRMLWILRSRTQVTLTLLAPKKQGAPSSRLPGGSRAWGCGGPHGQALLTP